MTFTRESAIVSINKMKFAYVLNDIKLLGELSNILDVRGDELVQIGGYVTSFESGLFGGAYEENYVSHKCVWEILLKIRGFHTSEYFIKRKTPFGSSIEQLHLSFKL